MIAPNVMESIDELEEFMTRPGEALARDLAAVPGDILILGVAGKMGPTLARLARRTLDEAGLPGKVIGVARFSDRQVHDRLQQAGVEAITADLLDERDFASLPDAPNVIYLAARKFGSTGDEPLTWAMNTLLPARVAERYRDSRIVALSTGNVYPLSPVDARGSTEADPTGPVGEYAQSCLGRERMFQYFSGRYGTPVTLVRLNYAIDLRYGVLMDIASKIAAGQPVPLRMGHVNVIWQGDANAAILRCLNLAASPPAILNLTGTETLSVREIARALAVRLGRAAQFEGTEEPTALLSDASRYGRLLGGPEVKLDTMLDWIAHWVRIGGDTLGKPTHFETRDGKF